MAKGIHKGTELNNINETWQQNERNRLRGNESDRDEAAGMPEKDDLQRVIKEEAQEYDNANKEDRLLSGDRATVNDDEEGPASNE